MELLFYLRVIGNLCRSTAHQNDVICKLADKARKALMLITIELRSNNPSSKLFHRYISVLLTWPFILHEWHAKLWILMRVPESIFMNFQYHAIIWSDRSFDCTIASYLAGISLNLGVPPTDISHEEEIRAIQWQFLAADHIRLIMWEHQAGGAYRLPIWTSYNYFIDVVSSRQPCYLDSRCLLRALIFLQNIFCYFKIEIFNGDFHFYLRPSPLTDTCMSQSLHD